MQRLKWWLFIAGLGPALAFASTEPDHTDPVAFVLLGVTTIFFFVNYWSLYSETHTSAQRSWRIADRDSYW